MKEVMRFSILAVGLMLAWQAPVEAAGCKMTITFGGYSNRVENLTNFPVLVVFSNNWGGSGFTYAGFVTTNGHDLRFYDSVYSSNLNYEIELWNTNGASFVWVQVPLIPTNGPGSILAHWGNPTAAAQLPCTTNGAVWTGCSPLGVWHLHDTNAVGKLPDSSPNSCHGVDNATAATNGVVAGGRSFNGSTANVDVTGLTNATGSFSFRYWVKTTGSAQIMLTDIETNRTVVGLNVATAGKASYYDGVWRTEAGASFNNGTWQHLAVVLNGASGKGTLCQNGVVIAENITCNSRTIVSGSRVRIGARYDNTGYWLPGALDEVRFSSQSLSTNWLWAEYQTMASNTTFSGYGAMTNTARRQMTIGFPGYTNMNEVLTNFPVLVVFSNGVSGFTYTDFLSTNGWDLRFVDSLQTPLNYEIEQWNTNGASYVWVQVPGVATNGSTSITAKWGDPANAGQMAYTTNGAVWTNGYVGVWHHASINDSTSNRINGTVQGSVAVGSGAGGIVGPCTELDGTDEALDFGAQAKLQFMTNTAYSLSGWIRPNSASSYGIIMAYATDSGSGWYLGYSLSHSTLGTNNVYSDYYDGAQFHRKRALNDAAPNAAWTHASYTHSGANTLAGRRLFVNGVLNGGQLDGGTPTNFSYTGRTFQHGRRGASTAYFRGAIDELRVSSVERSTSWIWAEYQTMASNTTFTSYGTMAEQPNTAPPAVVPGTAAVLGTRRATLSGSLSSAGGLDTVVQGWWGTNAATLEFSTNLGTFSSAQAFSWTVTNLVPATTFSYALRASNDEDTVWSSTNSSYATWLLEPVITNQATVSGLSGTGATVYGSLVTTGETPTVVFLLCGTNSGVWTVTNTVGSTAIGQVSSALSSLLPDTTYYYQFAATNSAGWGFSPATNSFTTLAAFGARAATNSLFDPLQYTNIAEALTVNEGTIRIDTRDGITNSPTLTVLSAGGATNAFYRGVVASNQSGKVVMGVLSFSSISISSNVSCVVTGNLGLVLASRGRFTFGATLAVTGGVGRAGAGTQFGGAGGPGAEAGTRAVSTNSAPPGAVRGNGGTGGTEPQTGVDGRGFGAGDGISWVDSGQQGAGGGYGGAGGKDSRNLRSGGKVYGDSALTNLFGGSGGGGAAYGAGGGAGGGGGGSVELIAAGPMIFSGQINAGGGKGGFHTDSGGGGGSGGGVILAAPTIAASGSINVSGGAGDGGGGGGGGGRISVYGVLSGALSTNVAGGAASLCAYGWSQAGAAGTYTNSGVYPFPRWTPPGTVIMFK